MNTTLPVSKHSKLLRLRHYLHKLHRRLSTVEPNPQPLTPPQDDEKKRTTQLIQLILETPVEKWSDSQPLQSLLLSCPPLPPRNILKITRSLPSYSQALNFFKHLRQNHSPSLDIQFLPYSFQALLEQASKQPDAASKLPELYRASKEWEVSLTVNAAVLLIRYFGRLEMVDQSILVFKELDISVKNIHVCNALIDVLSRDGRVDTALKVLDEMLEPESDVPIPPNDVTGDIVFYRLVDGDSKGRSLSEEELVKLVLQFGKHGVFPKPKWLTQLVSSLCKSREMKINKAWHLLHKLLRLGAPLESHTFNVLLSGLSRRGDVKRMNTVLVEMRENGIQPDIVTLGIIINQLCELRRFDDLLEVLNKMCDGSEGDGFFIEGLLPNTITYNCLIDGFCKVGEIDRGMELFEKMKEYGIEPDLITVNTLVDGMCRNGRINSALEFFNDMQKKGIKGNASTYTILITAFSNADNFGKVLDLFDEMVRSGCRADASIYYSLISGFCKAGRMDDAINIYSKMKVAGFRPDNVCYNSLISGFCKKKKLDKAYEIVKEMEEVGVQADSATYNTLVAYFCKSGDFKHARKVMKQMIENGLAPTVVTYGALIHGYCLNGKHEEAMKIFTYMSSATKIVANTGIYNVLIESLCKNNDVKTAVSLIDDMKEKWVKPNTTTYNAMFKGLKENNLLEVAFVLMDSMIENACSPDYITMEILTEWLSNVGELEKLKSFVQGNKVSTLTS